MRNRVALLLVGMSLLLGIPAAQATTIDLQEWAFHIDGVVSDLQPGDAAPAHVNAAGFNSTTGLGTLSITLGTTGPHKVIAFLDHEIDQEINTFFNEYGAVVNLGSKPAQQSYEIDEPGFVFGNIFDNLTAGSLDNTNGVPSNAPDDPSMALGWDFVLQAGETALIHVTASLTPPAGGFYLQHTDPDSNASIYLSGGLDIRGGPGPAPVPGTLLLVGAGLAGIAAARRRSRRWLLCALLAAGLLGAAGVAQAAPPVVKTVPWVASNALIPHDTWSGKPITLKGASDSQGANIQYAWDFGDGSPVATGTVTNKYVIEATHTYTGLPNTIYTARLTVQNMTTGETASREYFVAIRAQSLQVEVNRAIDEGLWYLHKTQRRFTSGVDLGDWESGGLAASSWYAVTAGNLNAFFVNGHLEGGDSNNQYVETVQRGMRRLFQYLTTEAIPSSETNPRGTFNPDTNGNGYGVRVNQGDYPYQGGLFMDAIVASGTPNKVTTTGAAPSGANPGILGRTYKDIVQDMADSYLYGQYDASGGGGWRYGWEQFPDNSACQWAAIGLIAAERIWSIPIPAIAKTWNKDWLTYSQQATGYFGYTDTSPIWGPYATTPSGMVQMVMDGIGRGTPGPPSWDKAETYIRNNFGNAGGASTAIKSYYYGLFSFVKSMLLHNPPIQMLQSQTAGVPPLDWYAAETSKGDPTDGVARTLVNAQNAAGYWYAHNYSSDQYPFETAWAIIMLNRTLFEAGAPVAVAKAIPNPGVVGQTITLDGSASFHQDASKTIDSWQWDCDNNGIFEKSGPVVTCQFGALGDYPVKLRVTDDGTPEKSAETTVTVRITVPPIAPTADAGGPYTFCLIPGRQFFLDGTGSANPDQGQHEIGAPPDTITAYQWELSGNNLFDDAAGAQPDVTAFFTAKGAGNYLIQLKVTDNTAASFPSSGLPDLTGTDSSQVSVKAATDPACACVTNLAARPKENKVQLTWSPLAGTHHYNIYRGTISGGPYLKIATTASSYSTYLDQTVVTGTTYYYVVRPAKLNDDETCQSNQASATPIAR